MLVLFLNFLIAILSAVFTKYENSKTGLYYEVLVAKMPRYIFDPKYGSIVCASPFINVFVWPFQWLTVCFDDSQNPKNSHRLYWINNLLCHFIYLPFAITGTLIYTFINGIITPFAYIRHILRLVMSLGILKKRVARSQRIKTTIVFAIFAPLYLAAAVVLEFIVFFLYLYAKPRAMGGDTESTPEQNQAGPYGDIVVSCKTFKIFSAIIRGMTFKANKQLGYIEMKEIYKKLQSELKIMQHAQKLLFENDGIERWV